LLSGRSAIGGVQFVERRGSAIQPRDPKKVAEFDYSKLGAEFAKLSRPARRALINHGILSVSDLSRHSRADVAKFHGIGPSAFPILEAALKAKRLRFKA